jgi:hypothetical protein
VKDPARSSQARPEVSFLPSEQEVKMKIQGEGRRLSAIAKIQAETRAVLGSIRKREFQDIFRSEGGVGPPV